MAIFLVCIETMLEGSFTGLGKPGHLKKLDSSFSTSWEINWKFENGTGVLQLSINFSIKVYFSIFPSVK